VDGHTARHGYYRFHSTDILVGYGLAVSALPCSFVDCTTQTSFEDRTISSIAEPKVAAFVNDFLKNPLLPAEHEIRVPGATKCVPISEDVCWLARRIGWEISLGTGIVQELHLSIC
jgi:hypothetical protein